MTGIGFTHSEIPGLQLVWQLPEAFRSLLRPFSVYVRLGIPCVPLLDFCIYLHQLN